MATFVSLFDELDRIEIPVLQRDFAQGRESAKDIRERFVAAIYEAILKHEDDKNFCLDLDFVYGSQNSGAQNTVFSVLDGQQRLTTLFLLHWYAALKDDCLGGFQELVRQKNSQSRFRYHTRQSSSEFFDQLVTQDINYDAVDDTAGSISNYIEDQNWFFLHWNFDPTISSCLVVLDTIEEFFRDVTFPLYEAISDPKSPAITFQFLNLEDFSLSDDLYIKMNGRGKPLTVFENFKAWLVSAADSLELDSSFDLKLDQEWTDLFWGMAKGDPEDFDDLYSDFFRIIALFDACRKWKLAPSSISGHAATWMYKLRSRFSDIALKEFEEQDSFNVVTLTSASNFLDVCGTDTFSSFEELLLAALRDRDYVQLSRLFARFFFIEKLETGVLSDDQAVQFNRWCRVCDNLIHNVRIDELSGFIAAIRGVIKLSEVCADIYASLPELNVADVPFFRNEQLGEEAEKASLISEDASWEPLLIETERHPYLMGQVGFILDLARSDDDTPNQSVFSEVAERISSLLGREILTSKDFLLQRALLSIDDYLVQESASKYSFCRPLSGTYRDRAENWLRVLKKPVFAELLDHIEGEVEPSLQKVIENSTATGWRQLLVEFPETIRYCADRLVHRDASGFFLLSKTRLSGYHAELWSFGFYCWYLRNGSQDSINKVELYPVYGDLQPGVILTLSDGTDIFVAYSQNVGFKLSSQGVETEEDQSIPPEVQAILNSFIAEFSD